MKQRSKRTFLILLSFFSIPTLWANDDYVVPRTEYGQPDLQGVWNYNSAVPLQRPVAFGNKLYMDEVTEQEKATAREDARRLAAERAALAAELRRDDGITTGGYDGEVWMDRDARLDDPRTSLIIYPENGRMPPVKEGVEVDIGVATADVEGVRPVRRLGGGLIGKSGPEDRGLSERCIIGFNAGPPMEPTPFYNNYVQVFQSRDHVMLVSELLHKARPVYMDDRPFTDDSIRQWAGDSRGYWDNDTLVVVTKNFNDLTKSFGPIGSKVGNSYEKTLTERFTRVADDVLEYEVTIDDPASFTDKIVMMVPMHKDKGLLYEYACHEGNYSMAATLQGARQQEQDALETGGAQSQ